MSIANASTHHGVNVGSSSIGDMAADANAAEGHHGCPRRYPHPETMKPRPASTPSVVARIRTSPRSGEWWGSKGALVDFEANQIAAWTSPCAINNRPAIQRAGTPGRQSAYLDRSQRGPQAQGA